MKIGIFTDSYLPSPDGVATSVTTSAKQLQKLGHQVTIIAPNQPNAIAEPNVFRLASIRVIKSPEIWWALEIPQPALFKIASLDFDIIHGHSGGPISFLGWQLAKIHNIPFVETYHTLWKYYTHYLWHPELVNNNIVKKIISAASNDSDAMITPSLKAKKDLLSKGVTKPIYIIPNGIDIEKFQNPPKNYLRKKFDIPAEKKILLTVGRLHKEKSIHFLIKAFTLVHKVFPECMFVIIGEGKRHEELQRLAIEYGVGDAVYFAGVIPFADMPKAYADADLFIFASQTESQGMVITEAFASRIPVVAVRDDAFIDVVENGVNGYMVKRDEHVFAEKSVELLKEDAKRKHFGTHAVATAKQFSVEETTRILLEIYNEIIFNKTMQLHNSDQKRSFFDKNSLNLIALADQLENDFKKIKEFYTTKIPFSFS